MNEYKSIAKFGKEEADKVRISEQAYSKWLL